MYSKMEFYPGDNVENVYFSYNQSLFVKNVHPTDGFRGMKWSHQRCGCDASEGFMSLWRVGPFRYEIPMKGKIIFLPLKCKLGFS